MGTIKAGARFNDAAVGGVEGVGAVLVVRLVWPSATIALWPVV
jgi:hypothetical protein